MNKTTIEWTRNPDGTPGYTWNPLTGCWGPGGSAEHPKTCPYCYARGIATHYAGTKAWPNGFAPTWHPERLDEPTKVKKPSRIFCGSMADPFAPWVSHEHLDRVLEVIAACPQHQFFMLTKWPGNILSALTVNDKAGRSAATVSARAFPNLWIGASLDTQARAESSHDPMWAVHEAGWHTLASIEPMRTRVTPTVLTPYDWIIIGAESGPGAKRHRPERDWIEDIMGYGELLHTPIFLKDSITQLWPELARKEWPNG